MLVLQIKAVLSDLAMVRLSDDAVTPGPVDATYPVLLVQAVQATIERRGMREPADLPVYFRQS